MSTHTHADHWLSRISLLPVYLSICLSVCLSGVAAVGHASCVLSAMVSPLSCRVCIPFSTRRSARPPLVLRAASAAARPSIHLLRRLTPRAHLADGRVAHPSPTCAVHWPGERYSSQGGRDHGRCRQQGRVLDFPDATPSSGLLAPIRSFLLPWRGRLLCYDNGIRGANFHVGCPYWEDLEEYRRESLISK